MQSPPANPQVSQACSNWLGAFIPQVTAKFDGILTGGEVLLSLHATLIGAFPAVVADVLVSPGGVDGNGGEHL